MTTPSQALHNRGFLALTGVQSWNAMLTNGSRSSCKAGSRLLDQGAISERVYALVNGRVRISYTEPGGHEVLMAIRGPGDLLGEYAQQDHGAHMATVWTLEHCETVVFTPGSFDAAIRRLGLEEALQQYILHKYRQIPKRLWQASNLQTEQRMALLLMEILNADPVRNDAAVPMTQQQISDALGVARSSVTRLLANWRDAGFIRIGRGLLEVLDRAALARRASRT